MDTKPNFELLSIEIEDEWLPTEFPNLHLSNEETLAWKYGYDFSFSPYRKEFELVSVSLSAELASTAPEDVEPIIFIDILNKFKLSKGLKKEHKVKVLEVFLMISVANVQGIIAAKYEGRAKAVLLPQAMERKEYYNEILNVIADDTQ